MVDILQDKVTSVQSRNKVSVFELLQANAGRVGLVYQKVYKIIYKHTTSQVFNSLMDQTRLSKIKKAKKVLNDAKAGRFHSALLLKMKKKILDETKRVLV